MRRLLCIMLAILPGLGLGAQQASDRAWHTLDSLVLNYVGAIQQESVEVKQDECAFLIGSVKDSLMRQHVALSIFDYYRYIRVMGEEAVAVHVFDEWIASKRVEMRSEFDLFDAERFVLENRRTLLGMDAPELTLKTPCGRKRTVPGDGRASVLFFYSPGCAKCRLETYALPTVLAGVDFPLDFYAVNVDTDRRDWRAFRKALKCYNKQVRMIHLWDPDMESGLLIDYGVFSTPKLFVVWDGKILGRRLEMENLQEMIQYISIFYGKEKEE